MAVDPEPAPRLPALDLLRGLAVFLMVLSGLIPYGVLPAWMYHAQRPPPSHAFAPHLAGITWVDLVLPLFVFCMGAAIPLAHRIRRPSLADMTGKGLLLAGFAIFLAHIRPHHLGQPPETHDWLLALAGFGLLVLMFAALPRAWSRRRRAAVRIAGTTGAVLFLAATRGEDGTPFSPDRSDIILLLLANLLVIGSVLWRFCQRKPLLLAALFVLVLDFHLGSSSPGWVRETAGHSPLPFLFKFAFLKYLLILIPALMIGRMLTRLPDASPAASFRASAGSIMLPPLILGTVLAGLFLRHPGIVFITTAVSGGWWFLTLASAPRWLRRTAAAGLLAILAGLLLDPFEGGIKKDPATLSYLVLTTGASMLVLVWLQLVSQRRPGSTPLFLLEQSGRNALLGYVAVQNLLLPLLHLSGIPPLARWLPGTAGGVIWAVLLSLATLLLSAVCARYGPRLKL